MASTTTGPKAIGFLELDLSQFKEAIAFAEKALLTLGAAFAVIKTVDFWKNGIQGAIDFGNAAYFASQKLNGYDPGKLFIVQKALEAGGLAADEARQKISDFALSGRPLEQLFKGGQGGFADALSRASKEYGTQAAILSTSAEKFAYVQQQLVNVGTKLQGFFLGLADEIAEPLSALFKELDKIDLVGIGQRFGGYITKAIDAIIGLVAKGNIFEVMSLALKVGFETALKYLSEGLHEVLDILTDGSFWEGVAEIAISALSLIGTFFTQLVLGLGKILVATVEAAVATLMNKFGWFKAFTLGAADVYGLRNKGEPLSEDIATNLRINNKSPLIAKSDQTLSALDSAALVGLKEGLKGIEQAARLRQGFSLGFVPSRNSEQSEDYKRLQVLIDSAEAYGRSVTGGDHKENPLYSETADPYHVIADSLAKVGGGGRYVRTGLSIAEKAQIDSLLVQKQIRDNTAILAKRNPTGPPAPVKHG